MRHKLVILFFLFSSSFQFVKAQYFTFEDINNINNVKEAEQLMYGKGLRNIKREEEFIYSELLKSNNKDTVNCGWNESKFGKYINIDYKLSKIPYKNFRETQFFTSNFARNYNSINKKALTFIEITYAKIFSNDNCENVVRNGKNSLSLEFQFNDKDDFEYFFSEIRKKAKYINTNTELGPSRPQAEYYYEKEKIIFENLDKVDFVSKGIRFLVSENDKSGFVTINLNSGIIKN